VAAAATAVLILAMVNSEAHDQLKAIDPERQQTTQASYEIAVRFLKYSWTIG
jgi:hypothetical protein